MPKKFLKIFKSLSWFAFFSKQGSRFMFCGTFTQLMGYIQEACVAVIKDSLC